MENIRTIQISAQQIVAGNSKFIACTTKIGDKWYKVKFPQKCEGAPKEKGLYDLTINFDNCSIERGKPYTSKSGKKGISNDTIWVRKIDSLRAYTEEDYKAKTRLEMGAIFGDTTETDSDLPY